MVVPVQAPRVARQAQADSNERIAYRRLCLAFGLELSARRLDIYALSLANGGWDAAAL